MVDLATLQTVAVATGGTRGDEIKTTAARPDPDQPVEPGRRALTRCRRRVAGYATRRQLDRGLPLGTISVIFDHDMYQGSPTDPRSVLDPANYQLSATPPARSRSLGRLRRGQPDRRPDFRLP